MTSPAVGHLVIVRHGETAWSKTGQHTSVTDLPLTAEGEAKARSLPGDLGSYRFGLVLVSPRIRARKTAELAGFGGAAEVDDRLVEWNYGDYEGMTSAQVSARLGRPWSLWRDESPGGESAAQVGSRVDAVLATATPLLDAGADVALFAHGHVLRVLTARWLGLPPQDGALFVLGTGSLSELWFEHGNHVISRWNCVPTS